MERENSSGFIWPQRNYTCSFCKRQFNSAQALGGHMNVHRRDRAMLIQLPSWVFDQSPNPNSVSNSNSKSHPNPNFSSSNSSSSTTTSTTLLPHRHYTHQYPFHLSSSSSSPVSTVTAASISSSSYQDKKPTGLYEDLTKKKNMRAVVEVEKFRKDQFGQKYNEIEVLKKSHEVISLDLEIGCKDSKEVLDLELRLGCF